MGSETLPSACYILSDDSSIPFYSTSNGYKKIPFHDFFICAQLWFKFKKLNILIHYQNVRGLLSKLSVRFLKPMLSYSLSPGLTYPYTIVRFCLALNLTSIYRTCPPYIQSPSCLLKLTTLLCSMTLIFPIFLGWRVRTMVPRIQHDFIELSLQQFESYWSSSGLNLCFW